MEKPHYQYLAMSSTEAAEKFQEQKSHIGKIRNGLSYDMH
jgi:hypothetical protein